MCFLLPTINLSNPHYIKNPGKQKKSFCWTYSLSNKCGSCLDAVFSRRLCRISKIVKSKCAILPWCVSDFENKILVLAEAIAKQSDMKMPKLLAMSLEEVSFPIRFLISFKTTWDVTWFLGTHRNDLPHHYEMQWS